MQPASSQSELATSGQLDYSLAPALVGLRVEARPSQRVVTVVVMATGEVEERSLSVYDALIA